MRIWSLKQSLKQSHPLEFDDSPILMTRGENTNVDLGSFQDVMFDHDLTRQLKLELDFEIPGIFAYGTDPEGPSETFSVELAFSRKNLQQDVQLDLFRLFANDRQECIVEVTKRRFRPPGGHSSVHMG